MHSREDEIQLLAPEAPPSLLRQLREDMYAWCRGRNWLVRLPLWLYFAWIFVNHIRDVHYTSLFGGLNLGLHEMGHFVFYSGGKFLHVAGGTILQLLAPTASIVMFFRQRDYFAIAICLGWISTNLMNIGVYMADAEKMVLPLVTVGDSGGIVTHDWRYLFTQLGLLSSCEQIGALTRFMGHFLMLACLSAGAWILWKMATLPPEKPALKR